MKKRLFAIILALVLIIGLVPTEALDVAAEGTEVTLAEDITGNSFTDTTAEPGQAYVYTVTGSDGTTYEVEVLPDGITSETVESTTYEFISVDSLDKIVDGTYMIVNSRWHKALLPTSDDYAYGNRLDHIPVGTVIGENDHASEKLYTDSTITLDSTYDNYALDWEIESTGTSGVYTIKNTTENKYLVIGADTAGIQDTAVDTTIAVFSSSSEQHPGSVTLSQSGEYLNMHGGYYGYFAGYEQREDAGAAIYLYLKHPAGTSYKVDTTALQTLVDTYEAENLVSTNYSSASWTAYTDALAAAKNILEATNSFTTLEAATAFQTSMNEAKATLETAYAGLELLEVVKPTITWQRTLEPEADTEGGDGAILTDIEYITAANDSDETYSIVTWKDKADEVLALTTDPNMTVWDYNTENQYSSATGVEGVRAATWNEHESTSGAWRYGSVRRFTGTFTWPEGYDVDDTVVYQSINDANYSAIYEYINSNAELKARYGNSKVLPINDDMFVFIRKANDTLTTDDYLNHMLFWSGTSGKGKWSLTSDGGSGDWDRTVPPTFNGVNALPAYLGIMPNNNDITGTTATVDDLSLTTTAHTDTWYTLVNSNTVMSTVKNLYGVEDLSNQTMIIDVFCFDNSEFGGMDEIELIFQKTPETATTVQVNYYLDSVLAANLLGSTQMTNIEDNTQITLSAGTNVNELDYYRFAAATEAGTVVSNGVQQAPVPYTVDIDKENNIINVVYTSEYADDSKYYFYDFGVENTFIYTPITEAVLGDTYYIKAVEITNDNITVTPSADKKDVVITYTPKNSLGEMEKGILNITFGDTSSETAEYEAQVKPIVIAPASNVLFEEGFMTQSTVTTNADWSITGTVGATKVDDNETTVFGYTSSYNDSEGESGVYTATVDADTSFTDNLQFQFGGTGFDLIGTCGPNTGTIAVKVVNSAGESVKNYLVDTSFTDTTNVVASGTTLYQVPLLQAKDLPEDTYTVTIRGAYIVYSNTSAASTYSLYGTESTGESDPIADIYDLLYGVGMTEDDIDCVEYINMGKLMGASTYAATEDTTTTTNTTTTPTEMVIGIDGFRSYRATDYDKYPTTELGVTYKNILDCVSDGFAAYIETKEDGTYTVNNYELSGGPQNEVYLTTANTSGLTIAGSDVAKQISLRSVDGNPVVVKINGSTSLTIKHTTEMYYAVEENVDGFVIIQVESGFLGIGNLKLTSGTATEAAVMTTSLTEDDYALVATTMRLYAAAPEVFEPETFDVDTKVQKNKYTVSVVTSIDVDYITVNGEVITKARTKRGSDEKVFTYRGRLNRNETLDLEIIAYDADGVASEPVTTEIESKPQRNKFLKRGGVR